MLLVSRKETMAAVDDRIPSGFAITAITFKLFEQNLRSDDIRPSSALSNSKVSLISCPSLPIIPIKIATLSASDFPEHELLIVVVAYSIPRLQRHHINWAREDHFSWSFDLVHLESPVSKDPASDTM